MSCNKTQDSRKVTDKELLIETLDQMWDVLRQNLATVRKGEDNKVMPFLVFISVIKEKAEEFKDHMTFYKLCCIPSFALYLTHTSMVQ